MKTSRILILALALVCALAACPPRGAAAQEPEAQARVGESPDRSVDPFGQLLPGTDLATPPCGAPCGGELPSGCTVFTIAKGDRVFFYLPFDQMGSWTEEVNVDERFAAKIPGNISVMEAGSIALPLVTAYEALGAMRPESEKVILIHGAGGGVGFQAVQLAVALGMVVVATASFKDIDKIHQAGAKRVIDYNEEDFSELLKYHPPHYVLDVLGGDHLMKSIGLKPKKVVTICYQDPEMKVCNGVPRSWVRRVKDGWKTAKFRTAAKRNEVDLIFHKSEANGEVLQQAAELGEHNIRCNVIAPGPVRTKLAMAVHTQDIIDAYHDAIPLNRYGSEEEIANAIFFLCSGEASYITGQLLSVDGGFEGTGIGLPALRK